MKNIILVFGLRAQTTSIIAIILTYIRNFSSKNAMHTLYAYDSK